jgi:hypothetical protein
MKMDVDTVLNVDILSALRIKVKKIIKSKKNENKKEDNKYIIINNNSSSTGMLQDYYA